MSDSPQGPGWWQASDGKWYPPEQAPGAQPAGGAAAATGGTDIGSALSYAFNKFTQNIGELVVIWLVLVAARIVFVVVGNVLGAGAFRVGFGSGFLIGLVVEILDGVVTGILLIPLARAAFTVVRGEKVDVGQAFQLSGPPLVAGIAFGVLLGLGYALCFLPALLVWLFLAFTPIIAVAENKGADALSGAWAFISQNMGEMLLFTIVAGLLSVFTCYLLAPVAFIAMAYLYNTTKGLPVAPAT